MRNLAALVSIQRGCGRCIFVSSVSLDFKAEGGLLFEFASWQHVEPLLPPVFNQVIT